MLMPQEEAGTAVLKLGFHEMIIAICTCTRDREKTLRDHDTQYGTFKMQKTLRNPLQEIRRGQGRESRCEFLVKTIAKIGDTRWICRQNRVPHVPVTSNAPGRHLIGQRFAATRCWPRLRRVDPILPTYPPRGTRLMYPPVRKWPDYFTTTTNHHLGVHASHPDEGGQEPPA